MQRNFTGLYEAVPITGVPNATFCYLQRGDKLSAPSEPCLPLCNRYLTIKHSAPRPDEANIGFYPTPIDSGDRLTLTPAPFPAGSSNPCNCTDFSFSSVWLSKPSEAGPFTTSPTTSTGKKARRAFLPVENGTVLTIFDDCNFRYERKTPELGMLFPPTKGLSGGAIAGIVVAVVAVAAIAGGAVLYVWRRKKAQS
ncbi:hypothetical protein HDU96_007650 [Phlyctochytrium bullatum]|nr:hypothetical protein HDU96_007650 [Phlyctochytrium bullatum]